MNPATLKLFAEVPGSIPSRLLEAIHSPESDVQIWMANLDSISPNDTVELIASLDSAERTRAAQFRFERDRQHYIAARGILRYLLGAALDIPASTLVFDYGPHGKPALASMDSDERTLRFNVSHAAGSAIYALAWDRNIGIDLESSNHFIHDKGDLSDLAMRVLSAREHAIWRALPDDAARNYAFLRAWTRKESYVKATGAGLVDYLQAIEVVLDAAAPQQSMTIRIPHDENAKDEWRVHDLPVPAGFVAALAIEI